MTDIAPSYTLANQELVNSFERYLELHPRRPAQSTIRKYLDTCQRFIESIGAQSAADASRSDIRVFQAGLIDRGLADNSIRLHTGALRKFYKFINLSGVTQHNPTLLLPNRKIAARLPIVLPLAEIPMLIEAGTNPFERAVPEVLYATGARVSEFVSLRIEDILWPVNGDPGSIRIKNGKGGKDRVVLFGRYAARAMREYLEWRPSQNGFLFEAPGRIGHVSLKPGRPYHPAAIRSLLNRLAHRAGIGHVHPHSLRRAMACHMLQSGADIRSIQELLGHARLSTTMLYTTLTAEDLKRVHEKCHPHENGGKGGVNGQ